MVGTLGIAHGLAGVEKRLLEGDEIVGAVDRDGTAGAVQVVLDVLVGLQTLEGWQALLPRPFGEAHRGPAVVVAGLATEGDGGVDCGGPAGDLAARQRDVAAVARSRLVAKAPVVAEDRVVVAVLEVVREGCLIRIVGAGLDQEDALGPVFCDPRCDHGAR